MRAPDDAPRQRRPRRPAAAHPEIVAAVARECLRREQERATAPEPFAPAVRATRVPWSRRQRPAGSAPTIELIRSLAQGERTRQQ
ncbi:MAG TPA: hypothetical protein VF121_00590 [Thermoanaerobaculia bacterium]|nr:hypothetical protein [Thermoanaerobaculia bacterium]